MRPSGGSRYRVWQGVTRSAALTRYDPSIEASIVSLIGGVTRRRVPLLAALALLGTATVACSSGRPFPRSAATMAPVTTVSVSTVPATGPAPAVEPGATGAGAAQIGPAPQPPTTASGPAHTTVTTARPGSSTTVGAVGGPTIAGCALFPADNPWRRDISRDPVDPRSSAWVASVGLGTHLHPDFGANPTYGIPYVVVAAGQPKVPITFTAYGSQSDPGPYPVPRNAPVEAGGDAHVLVASGDCHLYELYGASPDGGGGWRAAAGAVFDLRSDRLRPDTWTSADAAGLPILPGLVRWDEVQAGHIDHALRFTVSKTQRGFIHPATHQAGSTTDPNVAPMGARFRLKASFDLTAFHGAALVVLRALQRYGMFVADNGSNWFVSGATDSRWNDTDLDQLKTIAGSAFEVVTSGPVLH
ncbi:MAG: hypothetical protein QOG44_1161 [Acidimicrobiaceae bacterium]|nr:hypothetical protein [Acidimicrobiaceae bacterium]MDQ1443306.1 hypothetical protein [Acidimicrobiaceae bacterium]